MRGVKPPLFHYPKVVGAVSEPLKSADPPRDATPRIHGLGLAALRHYAPHNGDAPPTDNMKRSGEASPSRLMFAANLGVAYVHINLCFSP